jgi:uncharacterized phage-like protein YoqJ
LFTDISKCCCFTGHREIPKNELAGMREQLDFEIEKLYTLHGVNTFISGGAIGFDLVAAEAIVVAKRRHPDIHLVFALPCSDHSKNWSASETARLRILMLYADETYCLSETYHRGCMHERNRFMLDNSLYCISYCRKNSGGTYYTLSRAKSQNKIITEL